MVLVCVYKDYFIQLSKIYECIMLLILISTAVISGYFITMFFLYTFCTAKLSVNIEDVISRHLFVIWEN